MAKLLIFFDEIYLQRIWWKYFDEFMAQVQKNVSLKIESSKI